MKHKLHKNARRTASVVLCAVFFLLAGCGKAPQPEAPLTLPQAQSTAPTLPKDAVEYGGQLYVPRENIQTLLILGLDKFQREQTTIGYTNHLQSDFQMLVILDQQAKVIDVLHLNRDTMTEIRRLGVGGSEAGTFVGQLALAHTFGSGGSDSCLNAVKAVSNLLGGVKIDHYMTLTMDAVATLNDAVGGVTVELMEDFTEFDPTMEKGKEMTLMGDQALYYVRYRMTIGDGLNASRMKRQEQYLSAFYTKLMEKNQEDDNFLAKTLMKVNNAFVSDLTVTQLDSLAELMAQCTLNPFHSLKGETVKGEEFYEFYVDEEDLEKTVMELFYQPYSG